MSPAYMANQSGCAAGCTCCIAQRAKARRYRIVGLMIQAIAVAMIAASFPVEGLAGKALGITGMVALWFGWHLAVRRAGRIDAQLKQAKPAPRWGRGPQR